MTFKNLYLTAALLSFTVSGRAAGGAVNGLLPELGNPAKAAEIKVLAAGDPEAARVLLAEALRSDKDAVYRCAAIDALAASTETAVTAGLAGLLDASDSAVHACAIRAAGESRNQLAVEALLANIERYHAALRSMGPYEEDLKARLKAIDSIWALGEIGDPALMAKLSAFYAESDDVIRMNLLIGMGKLKNNPKVGPYLLNVAASPRETEVVRSVAFEMLAYIGSPLVPAGTVPSKKTGIEKGDIIFTGGKFGTIAAWFNSDLPIGHAGIFAGTELRNGKIGVVIADCVPDDWTPGGVRNIRSWKDFTHQFRYPYYGSRTTTPQPTASQRRLIVMLALDMGKRGLQYSSSHLSQKGPELFDCVGYTEYLYEHAGLNPTPDKYETGLGWPLTPWEQFDATTSNLKKWGRSPISKMPDRTVITGNFGALTGSFGAKSVQAPETGADLRSEAAE